MSARENASLELKIICATNVSHTNLTDKMDVYAVVSIIGDNYQTQTAIGWKKPMKVYWPSTSSYIYSYWLEGSVDLEIGEVNISVQEPLPQIRFHR